MPQRESVGLVITDIHYGKKTETFDPDACKRRLECLCERTARIRELLSPTYDVEDLTVFLLGDINDGTDIYATQPHHQAISNVEEQAQDASRLLADFLTKQKDIWGKVRAECVAGNHGRGGSLKRAVHEAANWDIVTYRYTAMRVERDGIDVTVPTSKDVFARVVRIRGHNILIHHGHWIRSWGGIPYYGIQRFVLNTSILSKWPNWKIILCGHFHCLADISFSNNKRLLLSGTPVTDDDFALSIGREPVNETWLFGVSDTCAPSFQFSLRWEDAKKPRRPAS